MPDISLRPTTAFQGDAMIAGGPLSDVALAVRAAQHGGSEVAVLVFDDVTGAVVDLDLRGDDDEIVERLRGRGEGGALAVGLQAGDAASASDTSAPRRGRPKLGVVSREVTLLPRHWDWLASQPGGASNALRRMVERALRENSEKDAARARREAAYRFMSAKAGDLPGFEEASRALFADDRSRFAEQSAAWPADVRAYAARLAWA